MDAIWVKNPLPLLAYAPVPHDTYNDAERTKGLSPHASPSSMQLSNRQHKLMRGASLVASRGALRPHWLLCMGLMNLRATPQTLSMLPVFLNYLQEYGDDQRAWNMALDNAGKISWWGNPMLQSNEDQLLVGQTRAGLLVSLLPNSAVRRMGCSEATIGLKRNVGSDWETAAAAAAKQWAEEAEVLAVEAKKQVKMPGIDDDWSDDEINTNLDAGQVPHVEDATSPKNSAVTGGDDETAENITALRAEQSSRAHALHETLPVAFPNVSFAEEESFSNSSISRTTSTTTQQAALNTAEANTTTILEGADNQPFDPMVFARPLKSYARTAESSSIGIVLSESGAEEKKADAVVYSASMMADMMTKIVSKSEAEKMDSEEDLSAINEGTSVYTSPQSTGDDAAVFIDRARRQILSEEPQVAGSNSELLYPKNEVRVDHPPAHPGVDLLVAHCRELKSLFKQSSFVTSLTQVGVLLPILVFFCEFYPYFVSFSPERLCHCQGSGTSRTRPLALTQRLVAPGPRAVLYRGSRQGRCQCSGRWRHAISRRPRCGPSRRRRPRKRAAPCGLVSRCRFCLGGNQVRSIGPSSIFATQMRC